MQAVLSRPAPPAPLPSVTELFVSVGGLVALSAVWAMSATNVTEALTGLSVGLYVVLGAVVLTAPALLVTHQFLGLSAPIEDVVGALAMPLIRVGQLAMGFSPAVLFFHITTHWGGFAHALVLGCAGMVGLMSAATSLYEAEKLAGTAFSAGNMVLIAGGWALLTAIIGLRLAASAAGWV
jgi:hypothetical protein